MTLNASSVRSVARLTAGLALIASVVAVPGVASAQPGGARGTSAAEAAPGRILVTWDRGASDSAKAEVRGRHGLKRERTIDRFGVEVVSVPPQATERVMAALSKEKRVTLAEPDYVLEPATDDPYYGDLWGLHNTGQSGGTADVDVDAPEAWAVTRGTPEVIVAVIDTGVAISHPDLAANIWTNPGEIAGNGIDDDGNGFEDDVNGWDFYNDDASVYDSSTGDQHGTHVAGTIAAVADNGRGVVGVAPNVTIMPLKFLGGSGGTGYTSDAVAAVAYADAHGATVINASWGGGGGKTLKSAIQAVPGAIVVAAAGNAGLDITGTLDNFPAVLADDIHGVANVLSVASVTHTGAKSSFSNYSATAVDLGAPGSSILSTLPGGYGWMSGTSMAAPHAAGAAALVASLDGSLTGAELVAAVKASATPLASMAAITTTGGTLNAHAALEPYATPGVPTDVTAAAGNRAAVVSWTAPTTGGAPTSYDVTVAPTDDVTGDATRTVDASETTLSFDGLTNGTAYTFTVTATNGGGTSAASAPAEAVTPSASVPSAPTALTAVNGDGHATLSWTAPDDDGGSAITAYTVDVSPADGVTGDTARTVDASETSLLFDGLTNGTAYTFTVAATNEVGSGAASDGVTTTPRVLTAPDAPTGVAATAGDGSATVSWTAPDDDGGRAITGYTVTADPDGRTATTSGTSATVTGLTNGTAYTFTVTATNAIGTSAASDPSAAVTPVAPPPPPSGGGGGGGFTSEPAPEPEPEPSPEPEPEPAPETETETGTETETETDEPAPAPYDGTGARSLDWACPGVTTSGFSDVPAGSTHAAGVGCAGAWEVFTGSSTGLFGPGTELSRGQLASVLARAIEQALGRALPIGSNDFTDIDGSVHATAIAKLEELGIVGGLDATTYAPGAPVTRGQFAAMLARTYRHLAGELPAGRDAFGDDDGTVHEATINGLAALGIVAGSGGGAYEPGAVLTRGQSATFVARLLDALVEAEVVTRPS